MRRLPFAPGDPNERYIGNLAEAIEKLDQSLEAGWRLVRVRIEMDDRGRRWLSLCAKRPRPSADRAERAAPPLDPPPGSVRAA